MAMVMVMVLILLGGPGWQAEAHPGRTDKNGGHTCRTNCKQWGLKDGEYHYHNGKSSSGSTGSSSQSTGTSGSGSSQSKPSSSSSGTGAAASEENTSSAKAVKVSIPSFSVKINGETVEQQESLYPLLVYKDITYFPMTWNYTKALGLNMSWDSDTGFFIGQSEAPVEPYEPETGGRNESREEHTAQYPEYNIFVNGEWLNNGQEDYPVLTFREITYFPLTWEFAVEQFGWSVQWNEVEGLSIQTAQ
nr:YHYH domain-containing protein [Paenibacillus sp. J2TS4]